MKLTMRATKALLVLIALTVTSCSENPVAPSFEEAVYTVSMAWDPIKTELNMTSTVVTARRIDDRDGSIAQEASRSLNALEVNSMRQALARFGRLKTRYTPQNPPTDDGTIRIELTRRGTARAVVIYPMNYSGIPDDLRDIVRRFDAFADELLGDVLPD